MFAGKKLKNKRGLEIEALGKILIFLAALVFVIILILVLTGKAGAALRYIGNILRFG